jgi:hypothetical protein
MSDLPAGPELDRLVAEKVMGWKPLSHGDGWWTDGVSQRLIGKVPDLVMVGEMDQRFVPSQSIAHAWEVVERMSSLGWWSDFRETINRAWYIEVENKIGARSFADAPTAPLAICLAALKAVGSAKTTA